MRVMEERSPPFRQGGALDREVRSAERDEPLETRLNVAAYEEAARGFSGPMPMGHLGPRDRVIAQPARLLDGRDAGCRELPLKLRHSYVAHSALSLSSAGSGTSGF